MSGPTPSLRFPMLRIGSRSYVVAGLVDAVALYCRLRDESGKGASTFPLGRVVPYWISYNGRVWESDPRKGGAVEVQP